MILVYILAMIGIDRTHFLTISVPLRSWKKNSGFMIQTFGWRVHMVNSHFEGSILAKSDGFCGSFCTDFFDFNAWSPRLWNTLNPQSMHRASCFFGVFWNSPCQEDCFCKLKNGDMVIFFIATSKHSGSQWMATHGFDIAPDFHGLSTTGWDFMIFCVVISALQT